MNNNRNVLTTVIVLLLLIYSATFVVDEREVVIKFRLGEIVRTYNDPGLFFMIPFLNNIKRYDSRLLTMDSKPEQFLTSEKKNVIVDSFVKWRITGPENFYRASKGDERIGVSRLSQIINDLTKSEFSKKTINDVVSGDRVFIMNTVKSEANKAASALGISVIDVRLKKVDLPDEVSNSVYARMVKERATVAKAFRSKGKEEAKGITAAAERESETIIAEAYKQAQEIKGQGDAISTEVYAEAFNMSPEFYSFYRSLDAYKNTFNLKQDILIIQPDSEFFKYFNNPAGKR
ncbi:MAG: HflC protein [Gammaproteobacteria bacterium]|nr:HflC protein [Gammaproteobacteria bacterium]|tara:strand:+ start:249776 stop:250645 length:870 start_codon:yes stop_codon:yes gene_type:complete